MKKNKIMNYMLAFLITFTGISFPKPADAAVIGYSFSDVMKTDWTAYKMLGSNDNSRDMFWQDSHGNAIFYSFNDDNDRPYFYIPTGTLGTRKSSFGVDYYWLDSYSVISFKTYSSSGSGWRFASYSFLNPMSPEGGSVGWENDDGVLSPAGYGMVDLTKDYVSKYSKIRQEFTYKTVKGTTVRDTTTYYLYWNGLKIALPSENYIIKNSYVSSGRNSDGDIYYYGYNSIPIYPLSTTIRGFDTVDSAGNLVVFTGSNFYKISPAGNVSGLTPMNLGSQPIMWETSDKDIIYVKNGTNMVKINLTNFQATTMFSLTPPSSDNAGELRNIAVLSTDGVIVMYANIWKIFSSKGVHYQTVFGLDPTKSYTYDKNTKSFFSSNKYGSDRGYTNISKYSSALIDVPPDETKPTQQATTFTKTHDTITVQMNASDTQSGIDTASYEPTLYTSNKTTVQYTRDPGNNTYTFTGLSPNKQYFFKYKVKDKEGNQAVSPDFEEVWTYGENLESVQHLRYEKYDAILKGNAPTSPAGTRYKIQLRPASGPYLESPFLDSTNLAEIRMIGMRVEVPEVPYTVYHAAFNSKGESSGWVSSGITIKIEDKESPEITGTMIRKDLTYNSYTLEILGASDSGVGLNPANAYSFIRKSQNGTLITNNPDRINTVTYTGLLPNERYENLYKVKDKKGNVADGNPLIFYTLGIPARNAEVIDVEGTSARFKLHLEPNPNGTRYVLKLVNPNVSQVLSNPQSTENSADVKMTGILPELEYELFVAPLNDENVEGTFKQMLYPVGHEKAGQKVTVKGELIVQLISTQDDLGIISDKVSKTYSAKIQAPMTTPTDLYLVGGGKEILVKKNILGDYAAIDLKAKLIKGSTQPTVTRDNDVLEVTVPVDLADGLHEGYKFVARSSVAKKDFSAGEFKFRIDTTPPETTNPTLNYISNTQAQLKLDMDSTTDNMSPKNQIMLRYKGKTYSISTTIPVEKDTNNKDTNNQVVFELVDNIGNTKQYTLDWEKDEYKPPGLGGTNDGKKLTEDDATNDDLVQTVSLPDAGQYYQVSFDGVQWSPWMVKPKSVGSDGKAEALVTLPSGDGKKTVYVRTGDRDEKTTPMYVGTDTPQEVPTLEYIIKPLQQMPVLVKEPTIDLTAPTLEIGTEDGLNIARDGKLDLFLTISDNIDRQPKVKIEVFGRDEATGALSKDPLVSQGPIDVPIDKKLTISLDLSALPIQTGKNYPYVLKVTAEDKNKNRTVETFSFYMK